jgi:D-amino peptidase
VTVLLVTDLEGVAGVDEIAALIEGQAEFTPALGRLDDEVIAALGGLTEGVAHAQQVRIADTHMGGPGANLRAGRFASTARIEFVRGANPADPRFHAGVRAVACLGMHGAGGGFVPHGVDLAARFENDAGPVSEAQMFLGVAAERGVPAIFVAGDEALGDLGQIPHVITKASLSPVRARSRPVDDVLRAIRAAAAGAPVAAPALEAPLYLRFRSRWMADRAEGHGARRRDETSFVLPGATTSAQIDFGCGLIPAAGPVASALRPWQMVEDVEALASRSFERSPPPGRQAEARTALTAFLAGSAAADDWSRANRALTLHMLAGHAPAFFAAADLAPALAEAITRLATVATDLAPGLAPEEAMARLDAAYVRHVRGLRVAIDAAAVASYLASIAARAPLHAWLMGEIAAAMGKGAHAPLAGRPHRRSNRVADLYWLTHRFLLATHYLSRPMTRSALGPGPALVEELLLAAPFALAHRHLDLAAELAFCMVAAGEAEAPERAQILAVLAGQQRSDGLVPASDAALAGLAAGDEHRRRADLHCTAAALLAFATAA